MSIPGTVELTGLLAPTNISDTYPITTPEYQLGGTREVADIAARNAISNERRSHGMEVFVQSNGTTWQLLPAPWLGDDSDWVRTDALVLSVDGTLVGIEDAINIYAGDGISLAASDNPTHDSVDLTITSTASLPAQTGNAQKTLVTDGTTTSWDTGYSVYAYAWGLGAGSNLVVGADKTLWVSVLRPATLTNWACNIKTPGTGSSVILDIVRCPSGSSPGTAGNWVSLFSGGINNTLVSPDHRPTLTASSYTATGTAFDVNSVAANVVLAQGDLLRIDIVQVGSTIAGKDLAVELVTVHHN